MSQSRRALIPLLLATALSGAGHTLAQEPAELRNALAHFVARSSESSDAQLDTLGAAFNILQLPAIAAGLDWVELSLGPQPDAYEVLCRWQFWQGRRLDPRNEGLWSLPHGDRRRILAPVAAAELIQLRALARMAERRGHAVDALAWRRDERILERRLLDRLFDPGRGSYGHSDSTGIGSGWTSDLTALATVGTGAACIQDATESIVARAFELDTGQTEFDDVAYSAVLDPHSGWATSPAAAALGPDLFAFLVRRALDHTRQAQLGRTVTRVLRGYGVESNVARVRLGNQQIDIPSAAFGSPHYAQTRAALDYLGRSELITQADYRQLRDMVDATHGTEFPDSVATKLLSSLATWRSRELKPIRRSFLREGEVELPAPNGEGATAFRFGERDVSLWGEEAIREITQDVLAYFLREDRDSGFDAHVEPRSAAPGTTPRLVITARSEADLHRFDPEGWRVRWTDGVLARPGADLELRAIDARSWAAELPAVPNDLGIWWVLSEHETLRLRQPPGIAVVEPVFTRILASGPPAEDGTQHYEFIVRNQVDAPLDAQLNIDHTNEWNIEPADMHQLQLGAGQTARLNFVMRPTQALGPGTYPVTWSLHHDGELVHSESHDLAVHFQWIWLGGFAPDPRKGLATRTAGDAVADLSLQANTLEGERGWQHIPSPRLLPEGWVELVPAEAPRGIYYALTAISSESAEILARVETTAEAIVEVNSEPLLKCEGFKRSDQNDSLLRFGGNHILVKMLAGGGSAGRFRLVMQDIEGTPLKAVENRLERLMDGYAYLRGGTTTIQTDEGEIVVESDPYVLIPVTFHRAGVSSVSVVGSFNGWSPTATPMVEVEKGKWRAEIRLNRGRFEYKFAVDGTRWVPDPNNPLGVPDGFGGRNSVIVLE